MVVLSLVLAIVIEISLLKSKKNGGVLISKDGSDISFAQAFPYQTLPTIIAVVYSILWAWIDLDIKRLEPYYQLSKPDGASGKDSVLLHYPYDFFATIPIISVKRRHWSVFFASTAMVLVTLGLVPFQSAIYSVQTIRVSSHVDAHVSQTFVPVGEQGDKISANYTYSTYAITFLNATLPPFMTKNFTVAEVRPSSTQAAGVGGNLTVTTQLYSLDLHCEDATKIYSVGYQCHGSCEKTEFLTSQYGCLIPVNFYRKLGNDTVGSVRDTAIVKQISGMYSGYSDSDGSASYYLRGYCPKNASHVFYSQVAVNKRKDTDLPGEPLTQFCQPEFFQQTAKVTLSLPSMQIVDSRPYGAKSPIPSSIFNQSLFEGQLSGSRQYGNVRGDVPLSLWPDFSTSLENLNFTKTNGPADALFAYAMGSLPRKPTDFLNSHTMQNAWEAGFRLLFSRYMSDVLTPDFRNATRIAASLERTSRAIVVTPIFAYLAQGLLYSASAMALCLLYISLTRLQKIRSDPAPIAAIMSLAADNKEILEFYADRDRYEEFEIRALCQNSRFALSEVTSGKIQLHMDRICEQNCEATAQTDANKSKGIRPIELKTICLVGFVLLNASTMIILAILYSQANSHGLPLPSRNRFVLQLLENYIPTAIATVIEPMWIVVSRYLCLLQPFESLRRGNEPYKKTLGLNYNSYPPQLVTFKALRAGHHVLATVSAMSLIANVLAVAMSSIFSERIVSVPSFKDSTALYEPRIHMAPNATMDDIYSVMTNLTSGTSFRPWADSQYFYLPVSIDNMHEKVDEVQVNTTAIGASLVCKPYVPPPFAKYIHSTDTHPQISVPVFYGALPGGEMSWSPLAAVHAEAVRMTGLLGKGFLDPLKYLNCSKRTSAAEFFGLLSPSDTSHKQGFVAGWVRSDPEACTNRKALPKSRQTMVYCHTDIVIKSARVSVDADGHIHWATTADIPTQEKEIFTGGNITELAVPSNGKAINETRATAWLSTNTPTTFMRAFNLQFITNSFGGSAYMPPFMTAVPSDVIVAATRWHNDKYPSDFINHFLTQLDGNSRVLDPGMPAPALDSVSKRLSKIYSRLFATVLATHADQIFEKVGRDQVSSSQSMELRQANPRVIRAAVYKAQTRIVMSTSAFAITEFILALYIITIVTLYVSRPARYLPRYPTTVASLIAYFAASRAISAFEGTSNMKRKQRDERLAFLGHRYGYGTFYGTDGKLHVGIEQSGHLALTASKPSRRLVPYWSTR